MPELPEVEAYRRLAERALHRRIVGVVVSDPRFVRAAPPRHLSGALRGGRFTCARRHGKLLILDVSSSRATTVHRVGLRFGMTGRLTVDGRAGVDRLVFASGRADPAWERFAVDFDDGGRMTVSDPRLLGRVELDPDEGALGPDALVVTPAQLRRALGDSRVAVKARLMDQRRVAGIGNLTADEVLWRASVAPHRSSLLLTSADQRRLHHHLRRTLEDLVARGGSHLGDLMPERHPGGRCPRDGAELTRSTVGGRTSWWCPRHQR